MVKLFALKKTWKPDKIAWLNVVLLFQIVIVSTVFYRFQSFIIVFYLKNNKKKLACFLSVNLWLVDISKKAHPVWFISFLYSAVARESDPSILSLYKIFNSLKEFNCIRIMKKFWNQPKKICKILKKNLQNLKETC